MSKSRIKITLTENILKVIRAYEASRPQGITASISFAPSKDEAPSIAAGAAEGATNATGAAAIGYFGGLGGMAVAGALGAVGGAINAIAKKQDHNKPESVTVELSYLEPEQFPINNQNVDTQLIKDLQERYNNVLRYQELKKSRGYFLGLGKNYKDDGIDDPKYFIAIFIGRKLSLAANASTKEECDTHLQFLSTFLEQLTESYPELLVTRSNDKTYLSLRTLIIWLKEREYNAQEKRENDVNNNDRLNNLLELVEKIHTDAETNFNKTWQLIFETSSPYEENDFDLYQLHDTLILENNDRLKKLKKDSVFTALFECRQDQTPITLPILQHLLGQAAKVSQHDVTTKMTKSLQFVLLEAAKIKNLAKVLKQVALLKKSGGEPAIIKILPEISILIKEMKQSVVILRKLQNAFFKTIIPLYSLSSCTQFKDNFAKYAFNATKHKNLATIDEAEFLAGLLTGTKDLAKEADQDTVSKIEKIRREVEKLNTASIKVNCQELAQEIEEKKEKFFDDFMRDAVIVDMEKSVTEGKPVKIPDEINAKVNEHQKKPWFPRLLTLLNDRISVEDELKTKLETARTENKKLQENKDAVILKLQKKLDALQKNKADLTYDKEGLTFKNMELETKNAELETQQSKIKENAAKILTANLHTLVGDFNNFIDDYKHRTRSGFSGIFSAHGNKGRENAKKFHHKFTRKMQDTINRFQNDGTLTIEDIKKNLMTAYIEILKKCHDDEILVGNYKDHSFKTYLLAYHDHLTYGLRNLETLNTTQIDVSTSLVRHIDAKENEAEYLKLIGKKAIKPSLHIAARL